MIRKLEGDIGVVAVSGAQRTGKSFILNLLLDRSGDGKGVSDYHSSHLIVQNQPLH